MFFFLIPLIIGFTFNVLSAFTAVFSRKWGKVRGSLVMVLFRDILGIPVWMIGFCLASLAPAPYLFGRASGVEIAGWCLIAAGGLIIVAALINIRLRSLAPTIKHSLARNGLYSNVRHPIHSGTILEFLGLVSRPAERDTRVGVRPGGYLGAFADNVRSAGFAATDSGIPGVYRSGAAVLPPNWIKLCRV